MTTRLQQWLAAGLMAGMVTGGVAVADEDNVNCPYGKMGGMGPGMMGGGMGMGDGRGMMGGGMGMMGGGAYHMLDLTDDQRGKINKLTDDERRKHWETMGKVMDERAKLRDLYNADKRDAQAIVKVQEQIDQHHRKMLELHLNTRNQIEALLTPEQREKLKSLPAGDMGPGMMGPGGMGRGMMR